MGNQFAITSNRVTVSSLQARTQDGWVREVLNAGKPAPWYAEMFTSQFAIWCIFGVL